MPEEFFPEMDDDQFDEVISHNIKHVVPEELIIVDDYEEDDWI